MDSKLNAIAIVLLGIALIILALNHSEQIKKLEKRIDKLELRSAWILLKEWNNKGY